MLDILRDFKQRDYSKTTHGVTISATPVYLEAQSDPTIDEYVWAYFIKIENKSDKELQLMRREWTIVDADGRTQNIDGDGVIGEMPLLKPGESFEYASGTPLRTASGIMMGTYEMLSEKGEMIKVDIPAFSLDSGEDLRLVN